MRTPTISPRELAELLSSDGDVQLVYVLGAAAYARGHIPGSLHFADPQGALRSLDPARPVIVYCSDVTCMASLAGQHLLLDAGFADVRRLAGGLAAWMEAGLPVEGGTGPRQPGV